MIELRSAYGAGQARLDGREPKAVAREVLWEIVALYLGASARTAATGRHDHLGPRNLVG